MIKKIGMIVMSSILISSATLVTAQEKGMSDAEQFCQNWAEEDGIGKSDIRDFMLACMNDGQYLSEQNDELLTQKDTNLYNTNTQPIYNGE
jgi:hypothetical protein